VLATVVRPRLHRKVETGRHVRMAVRVAATGREAAGREVLAEVEKAGVVERPAMVDAARPVSATGEAGHAAAGASKARGAAAALAVPAVHARALRLPEVETTCPKGLRGLRDRSLCLPSFSYGTTIALPTMSPLASA